jgi:hypothetical protein
LFRHLWHAFWARPDVPLLRLPFNALAVIAAGVAGWWDPMIWATAGGFEFVYLLTMASHPGVQHWLEMNAYRALQDDHEEARAALLRNLGGAAKQRYKRLEEKRAKVEKLYQELSSDDLLVDNNRDALRTLTWIFLRLLNAQRNLLLLGPAADAAAVQKQIASLQSELARGVTNTSLRDSKQATLELLQQRVDNFGRREESLAEIESDLARIESQLDLAVEDASLRGRPTAISARIEFVSDLIAGEDPFASTGSTSLPDTTNGSTTTTTTTTTTPRGGLEQ